MNIWLDRTWGRVASELEQAVGDDAFLLERMRRLDLKAALHLIRSAVERCETREGRAKYIAAGLDRAARRRELRSMLDRFDELSGELSPEEWRQLPPDECARFWRDWVDAEIELEVLEGTASPFRLLRFRVGRERAGALWKLVTQSSDLTSADGLAWINRIFFHASKARDPGRYIQVALNRERGLRRGRRAA